MDTRENMGARMNALEILEMRKAIKKWRDHWTGHISKDLDASTAGLKALLFSEVDKVKFVDAIRIKRYIARKLQPLLLEWCRQKEEDLLRAAEDDLRDRLKRAADFSDKKGEMEIRLNRGMLLDLAGTTLAGSASVATIPAIISFSTATVSAGGIAGFFGATTTVPIIANLAIGLIVLALMSLITFWRSSKVMANLHARLRTQIERQINERVVYSKEQPSLAMQLIAKIEDTSKNLLGELDHAA